MNIVKSRKGAVELSLNLIIMLVIGLTVLGLIIAFVTNFLGGAEDSFIGKLTEDDKVKIEQVQRESGNFAFLESTLNIAKGESAKLYIKVRNPTDQADLIVFAGGPLVPGSSDFTISVISAADGSDLSDSIVVQSPPITLDPGQEEGYALKVSTVDTLLVGTYFVTFTMDIGGETYSEIVTVEVE